MYWLLAYFKPEYAPALDVSEYENYTRAEKWNIIQRGLTIPTFLIVVVLGSIYGGVASVTEAAAVGVFGVALGTYLRGENDSSIDA